MTAKEKREMRRGKRLTGMATVLALVAAACTGTTSTDDTLPSGTAPRPNEIRAAGALVQFDACETFLDYVISHAVDLVGPYGLGGGPVFSEFGRLGEAVFEAPDPSAPDSGGQAGEAFSGTNVQVVGVDEPDIVKTDGHRIVLISEGNLIVVDVTGDEPVESGRLAIDELSVQSLFVSGDKALLFGSVWSHGPIPLAETDAGFAPSGGTPTIQIVEV
jgi:uncharacterized secreted protein with C-terminal beta-propeller domain